MLVNKRNEFILNAIEEANRKEFEEQEAPQYQHASGKGITLAQIQQNSEITSNITNTKDTNNTANNVSRNVYLVYDLLSQRITMRMFSIVGFQFW
jgi:hypothetical protein